jgi:hypothetical protein
MRDDKLELDVKILAKNLEITKLLTKIDDLTSKLVDVETRNDELTWSYNQLFNTQSINIKTDE